MITGSSGRDNVGVPIATPIDEQKSRCVGAVNGEERENETRFRISSSCILNAERGSAKLTFQAQCII